MVGKGKKIVLFVVLMTMTLNLFGCGKSVESGKTEKASERTASKDLGELYYRTKIDIENEEQATSISIADEGGFYVVTGDENVSNGIWHIDDNDSWEKRYDVKELLGVNESAYCQTFIGSNGYIFAECNKDVNVVSESPFSKGDIEYYIFDEQGQKHEVNLKLPSLIHPDYEEDKTDTLNHVRMVKYADDYMYALDENGDIFQISTKDYSVKELYHNTGVEYLADYTICDKTLIAIKDSQFLCIDITNGETDEKVKKSLEGFGSTASEKGDFISAITVVNGYVCTLVSDKIYEINLDTEEIMAAKVVGSGDYEWVTDLAFCGDKVYGLIYDITTHKNTLYKYEDHTDDATAMDADPRNLKIWIMDSSQGIDGVVKCFTDKYPNVTVEIEIGMGDYSSGFTTADAIKNLNTEILSGNGPDIIYLDGINPNSYIESGELYDMTEIIDELKVSGEYFNNILDTYKRDGKTCLVPSGVSFLTKVGGPKDLEASRDIKVFAEYIENKHGEHNTICQYQVSQYIFYEYYKNIKEELMSGSISREKLVEFFEAAKKLQDMDGTPNNIMHRYLALDASMGICMYENDFDFALMNITDPSDFILAKDSIEAMKAEVEIPAKDYEGYYLPWGTFGISANSTNIDIAKDFARVALSEECQSRSVGALALRVNKNGLKNVAYGNFGAFGFKESDRQIYDQYIEDVMKVMENLNKPFQTDYVFDQMIIDKLNEYTLEGSIDVDSAVDDLLDKVSLYLAE